MSFHLFNINEVYSNADGTVQFIEFVSNDNFQDRWGGILLSRPMVPVPTLSMSRPICQAVRPPANRYWLLPRVSRTWESLFLISSFLPAFFSLTVEP